MDIKKAFNAKIDRRRMLGNLGMMGAGAVLTACGTSTNGQDDDDDMMNNDVAILNFALNLEYLEAAFYLAAVGRISDIQEIGGDAAITLPEGFDGNTSIDFQDEAVAGYAAEIAQDELNHVVAIRATIESLEGTPVERPELDLGPAFAAAAAAAFDMDEPVTAFNPFANDLFFMHGAYIFEDVGVTAYAGAAPLVTDGGVLGAAAGILAVEAYHSGEVRAYLYNQRDVVVEQLGGVTVEQITTAISNLRGSVGGGKDQPIVVNGEANIVVAAEDTSIAFGRTPAEVLAIVYLGGAGTGGFFPQGLNGNFSGLL